jgi:hypothetical protein
VRRQFQRFSRLARAPGRVPGPVQPLGVPREFRAAGFRIFDKNGNFVTAGLGGAAEAAAFVLVQGGRNPVGAPYSYTLIPAGFF